MKRHVLSSLRARLMLLMIVAIVPWILAMTYHAWQDREITVAAAVDTELQVAHMAATRQDQAIQNARSLLRVLSALPEIRTGSGSACQARLADILHTAGENYANLLVTDAHGQTLCVAKGSGQLNFADRDWHRDALSSGGFVVGRYIIGRIQGRPILPAAFPILDAEGRVARVVMVALDVDWLGRLLRHPNIGADAVMHVIDSQGIVMARHPPAPDMVGKPYTLAPLVAHILAGKEEGTGEGVINSAPVLFAYTRLPGGSDDGGRVYVSLTVPKETVLSGAYHDFAVNLVLLWILTVILLVGSWYLTEFFVLRKVKALVDTSRRIAAGDFTARAALGHGHGELSELAQAFDEMAGSIERHVQQTMGIMEVAPEAIIIADEAGCIVMANAQTQKLFGYSESELIGQRIEMLIPERLRTVHQGHRERYDAATMGRNMGDRMDLLAQRKDGSEFAVDVSLGVLKSEQGKLIISAVRDISERKQFEAKIIHQATHDALTGLPNRAFFRELLARGLVHARREDKLLAVLFLDLDGFKNINDSLGHEAGDSLLKSIAQRIVGSLRKDDVVARQGGDEFTILLQGINAYPDIVQIAEKLLQSISEPLNFGSQTMYVTASIGVTIFPFDDDDVDSLLRNADTAMYQAKAAGKNTFRFYTAEMNAEIRSRVEIEMGLRRALEEEQFALFYQPQADIGTMDIIGVEALLRWNHPDLGLIPPGRFIPVAEESGLIVPIGEWVLRTACRQIKQWREQGFSDLKVAVNLSARQFHQENLLQMISSILKETGLDPRSGALELELTESMVMRNIERTETLMSALHAMGLRISIDDFGTGYSSLNYLKRFTIDTLKIDQSFVRNIAHDPHDAAIASTVVTLGHSLQLSVIAEGVETADQLEFLRNMGCDEIQGYYLSKPLPVEAASDLLHTALARPAIKPAVG